jgi:hypothetical protein
MTRELIDKRRAAMILGCSPRVVLMAVAGKLTMDGAAKLSRERTLDEARRPRQGGRRRSVQTAQRPPDLPGGLRGVGRGVGVATAKRYAVSLRQLDPLLVGKHLYCSPRSSRPAG